MSNELTEIQTRTVSKESGMYACSECKYGVTLVQPAIGTWQEDEDAVKEKCLVNIGSKTESASGGKVKVIKNTILELESQ